MVNDANSFEITPKTTLSVSSTVPSGHDIAILPTANLVCLQNMEDPPKLPTKN